MQLSVEFSGVSSTQPAQGQGVLLSPGPVWGWQGPLLAATAKPADLEALRTGQYLVDQDGEKLFQVAGVFIAPLADGVDGPAYRFPVLRRTQSGEMDTLVNLTVQREGLSLAWVTLSDKGAAGLREDKGGPAIEQSCRKAFSVSLARGCVLPDDPAVLRERLMRLAYVDRFDLIVTTGGTGLAPRDTTPETTLTCIERRLRGFEQAMMAASLQKTPKAVISRAVAGTMGGSIVINLPGSPKAVAENLEAVLPAVEHAVDKLQGDPSDCAS